MKPMPDWMIGLLLACLMLLSLQLGVVFWNRTKPRTIPAAAASVLTKHERAILENAQRMYLDWDQGKREEERWWKELKTKVGAMRLPAVRGVK